MRGEVAVRYERWVRELTRGREGEGASIAVGEYNVSYKFPPIKQTRAEKGVWDHNGANRHLRADARAHASLARGPLPIALLLHRVPQEETCVSVPDQPSNVTRRHGSPACATLRRSPNRKQSKGRLTSAVVEGGRDADGGTVLGGEVEVGLSHDGERREMGEGLARGGERRSDRGIWE